MEGREYGRMGRAREAKGTSTKDCKGVVSRFATASCRFGLTSFATDPAKSLPGNARSMPQPGLKTKGASERF